MLEMIEPFIWGFAVGYFAHPIYTILTRIWSEAKIAKDQWRDPQ